MSSRFNPVALLTRRRSKSKSKTQSESSSSAGVPTATGSGTGPSDTQSPEPRVTTKPARTSMPSDEPFSPRVRFRVFTSLRRARSPRRRSEKQTSESGRAISVPPKMRTEEHLPVDVPLPPSIKKLNDEIESAQSAAPLAQHDCFELTDVSDAEHDDLQSKRQLFTDTPITDSSHDNQVNGTVDSMEQPDPQTPVKQSAHRELSKSQSSVDEELPVSRTSIDMDEDTEDEDTWQTERMNRGTTVDSADDSSVTKLSVEYETEYPICENTDSTLSPPSSPLNQGWAGSVDRDVDDSSDSNDPGRASSGTLSSEKSFEEELEDVGEQSEHPAIEEGSESFTDRPCSDQFKVNTDEIRNTIRKCEVQVNVIPADSESEHYSEDGVQEETVTTVDQSQVTPVTKETYDDNAQSDTYQEEYVEPQFEVEPDPEQDPFYAVELAATQSDDQDTALYAPSIIVTSASTGSLHLISDSEPPQPVPARPPPPPPVATQATDETVPKRPPAPSSVSPTPGIGPPPRPPSKPPGSPDQASQQQKKKKLFGVVDLGPLPSDPDPNFPFRKHLDKSVVPNPKKAIQRIIRGETKAERRQRKEQEELSRLLKTTPNESDKPVAQTQSKVWEEFQQLTAQIEHTVQESVSKVQVLAPSEPIPNSQTDENWAQFESAFGQSARGLDDFEGEVDNDTAADEIVAVESVNPWEQTTAESGLTTEPSLFETGVDQPVDDHWATADRSTTEDLFANQGTTLLQEKTTSSDGLLPTCDLELDLEFESLRGTPRAKLTQDIDTFLGLEETQPAEPPTEPLVSDPLELIKRLKPSMVENPLEDLGMTVPQTEEDSKTTDPNLTQLIQNEEIASEYDSVTRSHEKFSSEEVPPVGEISESEDANQAESHELGVPQNAIEDTSDMDEPADDVLWGGFTEIHVSSNESPNPFSGDDFSVLPTATVERKTSLGSKVKPTDEQLKSIARPRNKPVRQETLSGNNPFRKKTDEAEENVDELTRAAAGIELVSVKIPSSHKVQDSFESSASSIGEETGLTLKPVPDDVYDITLESQEMQETVDSGFDPLQTIYPESENESIASEDHDQEKNEPAISITINELSPEGKSTAEESVSVVPTIQAPPEKPKLISESIQAEQIKDSVRKSEPDEAVKRELPAGWIDFSEEPTEPTEKQVLSADDAFNVDWAAVVTSAHPVEPEPPRPDTPDPELDIPFHPPVDENAFYRLWLRYPEKKTRVKQVSKYTTDRYWREVAIHFTVEHDRKMVNLHEVNENTNEIAPEPYRSIRIEPYMQLSREKLQQYDKYGKLHVFKLNHVSYRELVGIRPEKFSIKTLQHLVTHKPKQNVAVDHLPVYTEILKFGSLDQEKVRQLMPVFEDALMKIPAHKDSTLSYNREEVCCYVVDEYQGKVSATGTVQQQKARTRILCTAFVNGGPHIVLGLNDKWRYGREVVRRSDILPVMHDEWISIRNPEFHSCVEMDAYEKDHMLKFYPLDGCRFELLRFRVSLRSNRELPMLVKCIYTIDGRRVQMRCELLVPGFFSACNRKGAVPCENVEIHIPVPEDWIYHFRVEKHHKYGSVHSTLRKPGRIKGFERITQMAQSLLPPSILEASIGLAKYEHLYKAVVWRIPRVPEKSEASFRPHLLTCKLNLAAHDTVPEWETLVPNCQVEYTMPSSTVSGATVRSISVEHTGVAEKFVKYTSKYRYTVAIDYQLGSRKEPVLKGILDELPAMSQNEEVCNVEHDKGSAFTTPGTGTQENATAMEQNSTSGVADLLGLGMSFGDSTQAPEPSQEQKTLDENPLNLF